jgi:hypothetical protein
MAALPSAPPHVARLAAPLLFGVLFNWTLYGVLCVQIYIYSYNFSNDKLYIKLLTYSLFVLETIQTALTGADLYYWFVTGFGDVERLSDSHFAPIDVPIMVAVTSFIVQGYYCYRIWMLNRQLLWFCCIIAVFTVAQSTGALWAAITSLTGTESKYDVSKPALFLWSIASTLADILIAVAMTILQRRASGGFSDFVLIRVVRVTIETNALTASAAVTSLVLYAAFPNEIYYAFILDFIGKLYSNTFLVSLNNRIYLRDRLSSGGAHPTVPDQVRTRTVTLPSPRSSDGAEPRSRESMSDTFHLYDISRQLDLKKNKGNGDADVTDIPATP